MHACFLSSPPIHTSSEFRVVRGAEKPFAEDQWTKIRIGGIEFHGSQPCERCMLPRVDPETGMRPLLSPLPCSPSLRLDGVYLGEMNKIEPTRTLTSYRTKDGRHYFGRYFLHSSNTGMQTFNVEMKSDDWSHFQCQEASRLAKRLRCFRLLINPSSIPCKF